MTIKLRTDAGVIANASAGQITQIKADLGITSDIADAVVWGGVTGTLGAQTDLDTALAGKAPYLAIVSEGASFVLTSAHANRDVHCNSASAIAVTWNVGHGMTAGDSGYLYQVGEGLVTLSAGSGTRTLSPNVSASATTADGSWIAWTYIGADELLITNVGVAPAASGSASQLHKVFRSGFEWAGTTYAGNSSASAFGGGGLGNVIDSGGTTAASQTDGGTGTYGWRPRLRQTAAAIAANRACGYNSSNVGRRRRLDATKGGNLPVVIGGGVADANALGTFFLGIAATAGAIGTTLTGIEIVNWTLDHVGIGADSTDANLSIFHNDNAGAATKVALGANFPKAQWTWYDVFIESISGGSSIRVTVMNGNTGNTHVETITTNLPRSTQDYYVVFARSSTAAATSFTEAPKIDVGGFMAGDFS